VRKRGGFRPGCRGLLPELCMFRIAYEQHFLAAPLFGRSFARDDVSIRLSTR